MADPTDPATLVQQTTDKAIELIATISKINLESVVKEFKDGSEKVIGYIDSIGESLKTLGTSESIGKVTSALGTLVTMTSKFDGFKGLAAQSGNSTSTIVQQFDLLVERTGSYSAVVAKLAGSISPGFAKALQAGQAAAHSYLEHASNAQELEQAYIGLAGATGRLGEEFNDMTHLGDRVAKFNDLLANAAGASGKTIQEVSKLAMNLGAIPGALDDIIQVGPGTEGQLDRLVGSFRLASGAGVDVSNVTKAMQLAYVNLANTAGGPILSNTQRGAQVFALMSQAAEKLKINFSDTQLFLEHVADRFKMFGDNTLGATNILTRFTGALQETGLTAKTSIGIVQGMVDAITHLDTGTKALLSSRTGGAGGLQGALQINQLLRQGKADEVAKKLEQSLRQQLGGRIISEAEGATSQQAAEQFTRQKALVQSPAFGGLAKDDTEATHLVEALSKGSLGDASKVIKSSMEAVKTTADRGNELQGRQYTVLNQMNSGLDRLVSLTEQRFLIDARGAIGTGKQDDFARGLENYRSQLTNKSVDTSKVEAQSADKTIDEGQREGFDTFAKSFGVMPKLAAAAIEAIGGAGSVVSDIGKNVQSSMSAKAKEKQIKADQDNTAKHTVPAAPKKLAPNPVLPTQTPGAALDKQRQLTQRDNLLRQDLINAQRPNLATEIPTTPETTKHEVSVEPMTLNISVSADDGLNVKTSTSQPKNMTVKVISQTMNGGGDQRQLNG